MARTAGDRGTGGELSGLSCGHQKTPGRAPCDAQPGCESSQEIDRSGSQSDRRTATATALLDQAERPRQERRDAPEAGGIDLGN